MNIRKFFNANQPIQVQLSQKPPTNGAAAMWYHPAQGHWYHGVFWGDGITNGYFESQGAAWFLEDGLVWWYPPLEVD